jgi:hypothetical protein
MIIHGFALWKFAKPDREHHLQVGLPCASLLNQQLPGLLKRQQKPNGTHKNSYIDE